LIALAVRVADYRLVFVAAQDGFNGDVFSSVDTLNHLRGNRICRPKIGGFNRDAWVARVIDFGGLVRVKKPDRATWKKLQLVLEIGVAGKRGFARPVWAGD
jgi:hypothetical protein